MRLCTPRPETITPNPGTIGVIARVSLGADAKALPRLSTTVTWVVELIWSAWSRSVNRSGSDRSGRIKAASSARVRPTADEPRSTFTESP